MEHEQVVQNVKLLQELLGIGNQVWLWQFDKNRSLIETNCPTPVLLGAWIKKNELFEIGKTQKRPIIITDESECIWGVTFEIVEEQIMEMYAIGPVFSSEVQNKTLEAIVKRRNLSVKEQKQLFEALKQVPSILPTLMLQQLLMLHYCVTGTKAELMDIFYLREAETLDSSLEVSGAFRRDRHKVYQLEQSLLQTIREGNTDYRKVKEFVSHGQDGVKVSLGDPLRKAKINAFTMITLSVRAAIEGGVSPEYAYEHGDKYIQSVELSSSLSDVTALSHQVFDDFVHAVHRKKITEPFSPVIQRCCDQIQTHLDQPIKLEELADMLGYTPYYLSKKFYAETGMTIGNYIKKERIERAKILLQSTGLSIQAISDYLQFANRGHFSTTFKKLTGKTPAEFRESSL